MTFPGPTAENPQTLPGLRLRHVNEFVEEFDSFPLERRNSNRITRMQPVTVYEPYASRFFGGQTLDVSAAGMKLRLPGFITLRAGRIIDLHAGDTGGLPLPKRRKNTLCRVVWTQTDDTADRPSLIVGVEFLSAITAEAA